jgi:hypothetical protein
MSITTNDVACITLWFQVDWFEALKQCRLKGMELASIETPVKSQLIAEALEYVGKSKST